jgi:predicted Zn-dependent peptidase
MSRPAICVMLAAASVAAVAAAGLGAAAATAPAAGAGAGGAPASSVPAAPAELLVHPGRMAFPELTFRPPRSKRRVLANGMVLHVMEDHELPLVHVRATVRTGAYLEPDARLGLADICGAVMRTGGTRSMDGDALDEELEFMAGSVETWIGEESGGATLSVLRKDMDRGLALFADVLMNPAFAPDKLELKKGQVIEAIRRRNDQPGAITQREWRRKVYAGHPFGRISTIATVRSITRADLVEFHRRTFFPRNILLAASGDFEESDLVAKLERAFSGWKDRDEKIPAAPEVPLVLERSLEYIRKDVPQANIRIGHLGVTKADPDWHALEVMDAILGGNGFVSRLMREVRSNRGLAYSVGSAVTGGRSRGVILASLSTKSKSCVEALSLVISIMDSMREKPPTEEELRVAKESLINSFVFQFTSAWGTVTQAADLEYLGLPPDWLETYRDRIAAIAGADVHRVAGRHLHPGKARILVVGKPDDFDKPLSALGAARELPLPDYEK